MSDPSIQEDIDALALPAEAKRILGRIYAEVSEENAALSERVRELEGALEEVTNALDCAGHICAELNCPGGDCLHCTVLREARETLRARAALAGRAPADELVGTSRAPTDAGEVGSTASGVNGNHSVPGGPADTGRSAAAETHVHLDDVRDLYTLARTPIAPPPGPLTSEEAQQLHAEGQELRQAIERRTEPMKRGPFTPPGPDAGPNPPPRYDAVFHEGMAWLDSLDAPAPGPDAGPERSGCRHVNTGPACEDCYAGVPAVPPDPAPRTYTAEEVERALQQAIEDHDLDVWRSDFAACFRTALGLT
jgi:hypothetical protein